MNLSTPYLLLDEDLLDSNIKDMARFARENNLNLRPHAKAHKMLQIAGKQIEEGANGLTVSKISEMEVFADGGFLDLYLAYELTSKEKINKLFDIAKTAAVSTTIDNPFHVQKLAEVANLHNVTLDVLIEVDSGLHRCGVIEEEDVLRLAKQVQKCSKLRLKGLMTHAGHVYGVKSQEEVKEIGLLEGSAVVNLAEFLRQKGISIDVVSVGSTPTAKIAGQVAGVTEIRPGNYCFYDAIQVGLGVVPQEKCALRVHSQVISISKDRKRIIIDAGSKTLALDKGAHGTELVNGFGIICHYPNLNLTRLSEEHGVIEVETEGPLPQLGEILQIIPNHACPVINLSDMVYVAKNGKITDSWAVSARGKIQ